MRTFVETMVWMNAANVIFAAVAIARLPANAGADRLGILIQLGINAAFGTWAFSVL